MQKDPAKTQIVAVTCVRDDGSYFPEWVAHHLPLGFDHFVVLSHDCTDGTPDLLDAMAGEFPVTHIPFRHTQKVSAQWQALKLAQANPVVSAADWILFFDLDEFLWLPPHLPTLLDLLAHFESINGEVDAIAIPWRLFGSGGAGMRADGMTPERFVNAAPPDLHFPMGHLFKSLIRPSRFAKLGIHRPRNPGGAGPQRWCGPDGMQLPSTFARQNARISLYGTPRGADLVGLNHYSLRSVEEFLVKRARGLPNHMEKQIGLDYWVERNWNTMTENRILPMLNASRSGLSDLMATQKIRRTAERCREEYDRRAVAAKQDLNTLRLAWQIGLLAENSPPNPKAAADYITAQGRLRAAGQS